MRRVCEGSAKGKPRNDKRWRFFAIAQNDRIRNPEWPPPMLPYFLLCHPIFSYVTLFSPVSPYFLLCHPYFSFVTLFSPVSPLFLICHPFFTCHPEAKPKGLLWGFFAFGSELRKTKSPEKRFLSAISRKKQCCKVVIFFYKPKKCYNFLWLILIKFTKN